MQWLANKDRYDFTFYGVPYWPIEKLIPLFDPKTKINHRVDFVLVTEPGAEGVFEDLPNSKTSGAVLDWIRKQEGYTCVETLLTPKKKKYCLFMALPNFSVFDSMQGLSPKIRADQHQGNPVVCAAMASTVGLTYESPTSGSASMEVAFRGQPPLSHVVVTVMGNPAGSIDVVPSGDFVEKTVHFNVDKGLNRIDLVLLDKEGKAVSNPSVQFKRLRITPPGDPSPMTDIVRKVAGGS